MKRIVFLSRSKLALNLMELLVPFVPKKAQVSGFSSLEQFEKTYFAKPVQLIIVDENFLGENGAASVAQAFKRSNLKGAGKIVLVGKNTAAAKEKFSSLEPAHFHTKPFLPEELAAIIDLNLGSRK